MWTAKTAVPFAVEAEWISSRFGNGTGALGGYVQGIAQVYTSKQLGDLSVFVRPELAVLSGARAEAARVVALRSGLDWNLPWTQKRANALLEGAWHDVAGPSALLQQSGAAWELGFMLRLSLTRHVRFVE